jgi:hypothetical protein
MRSVTRDHPIGKATRTPRPPVPRPDRLADAIDRDPDPNDPESGPNLLRRLADALETWDYAAARSAIRSLRRAGWSVVPTTPRGKGGAA